MAQYQVFDGKAFIPYEYTKPIAVALAKKRAALHQRDTQVWRNGKSGLEPVLTIHHTPA